MWGPELALRFGWSPPTVRKVLEALIEFRLVKVVGRRYRPLEPDAVWPPSPATEKNQPTKSEKNQPAKPTESDKIQSAKSHKANGLVLAADGRAQAERKARRTP